VQTLGSEADAIHFVEEAYKHCKPIGAGPGAEAFLRLTYLAGNNNVDNYDATDGVIIQKGKTTIATAFIDAMKQHRFWGREKGIKIPA
jgi:catalase